MTKHLKIIMEEMCNRVGVYFDDIDFKEDRWYQKYSWSEKEEESFKEWLLNYLLKNKEAREELLSFKSKTGIKKAVDQFMLGYGWKIIN